ncbi:MAG: hypothetical protein ACXACX_09245 [Candidatus Hodarchaeales archaeon]|jgi:hypothetical protein
MGIGGIFKKIGSVALDVFQSPIGDILIAKFVPVKFKPLIDEARKIISSLEQVDTFDNNAMNKLDKREKAYRELAIKANELNIDYKPSELYSLVEDMIQEEKGTVFIKDA